jgi:hypothetical protein
LQITNDTGHSRLLGIGVATGGESFRVLWVEACGLVEVHDGVVVFTVDDIGRSA